MTAVAMPPRPATRNLTCPGCRLVLEPHAGPTHAYVGASAACWELYCQVTSPSMGHERGTRERRLVEDAYAAQHPGVPHRRSLQSVAVHLMGLCVLLERAGEERRLVPVLGRMPARKTMPLHWLAPPEPNGRLTIADVLAAGSDRKSIEAWARSVWTAWAPHHATVRGWLDTPCVRLA